MIQEEVLLFKALINKNKEEPFDFINQFNLPILNALWKVTVGERFEYDDPRLMSIIERLTDMFKRIGKPENVITLCFPWINKIFPSFMERDKSIKTNHDIMNLMFESIKHHQQTLDPNEPRDFTDKVLIEIQQTTDETSSFYGEIGIENLANTLFDLFLAGSETTSTTLTWAALYMIRYPQVQKKVQDELDRVVGTNKHPSLKDRPNLPYTEVLKIPITFSIYLSYMFLGSSHGNSEICQYCAKRGSAHLPQGLYCQWSDHPCRHPYTAGLHRNLERRLLERWNDIQTREIS